MYDRNEFIKWHEGFVAKYGVKSPIPEKPNSYPTSRSNYYPDDINLWVDKIDNSHKELRDILGGVKKSFILDLSEDGKIDISDCQTTINAILKYLPEYLSTYDLTIEDISYPTISKQKDISTTKHIMGYVGRKKITSYTKEDISYYCSALGQIFENRKLAKGKYEVTISTHPKEFSSIGSFNIDKGSCFAQGSFNSDKKYTYAIYPNSAVVIAKKESETGGNITLRGLMIFDLENQILHASNIKTSIHSITNSVLRRCAEIVFGTDQLDITNGMFSCAGGMTYLDQPFVSLWNKQKQEKITKQTLTFDTFYYKEATPGLKI
jgi:hypothetical protein